MKGLLGVCLLAAFHSMNVAQAYEGDIHFSTTYVLARAAGWPDADALTIASANQGVDENQETVAALEVDTTPTRSHAGYAASSLHQADKNLTFHCFSKTSGDAGHLATDVLEVVAGHFAAVPGRDDDARSHAERLIALGAALHCQQDAYSHEGFGGTCGAYSGSCYGHTYENFLDQVVFGLLKKHHFNPDHPGVSGPRLQQALQGTARELAARRTMAPLRPIPSDELAALSDRLRASGHDLPDDLRRDCNRYVAGKWLFAFLDSRGKAHGGPDAVETLAPGIAVTCRNASLASATVVKIPAPRYPRLNADASPLLVRADGTYQLVRGGDFEASLPSVRAEGIAGLLPNYTTHRIKVQLSHWSQLLALPIVMRGTCRAGRDTHRSAQGGCMTNDDIVLVQRSWSQVLPLKEEAADLFYRKLFELDPSLRRLFTGSMEQQGARLMQMITAAVGGLNHLDALLPVVRHLGERHGRYGVRDEHYDTVATALLWTLEQGLRDGFTPDVKSAWIKVYGVLSQTMRTPHDTPHAA